MLRFIFAALVMVGLVFVSADAAGPQEKNRLEETPAGWQEGLGGRRLGKRAGDHRRRSGGVRDPLPQWQQSAHARSDGKLGDRHPLRQVDGADAGCAVDRVWCSFSGGDGGEDRPRHQGAWQHRVPRTRQGRQGAARPRPILLSCRLQGGARTKETLEITKRAKEIIEKMQAKYPKKDLKTMVEDKVVTPTHTIVGRIVTTKVKTKSDYSGEIDHQLAHMRTLLRRRGGQSRPRRFGGREQVCQSGGMAGNELSSR